MYFACLRIMNETDVRDTINVLAAIVNHANREFVGSFIKRQRVEVRRAAAAARERETHLPPSSTCCEILKRAQPRCTQSPTDAPTLPSRPSTLRSFKIDAQRNHRGRRDPYHLNHLGHPIQACSAILSLSSLPTPGLTCAIHAWGHRPVYPSLLPSAVR